MAFWTGHRHSERSHDSDLLHVPESTGSTGQSNCRLRTEIAIIDTRSSYLFGPGSRARAQVKALLQGAIDSDLKCNERRFIDLALQTFHDRVLSRSRAIYMSGVFVGVAVLVAAALLTAGLTDSALRVLGMATRACCALTILFAGMGTLCSVFARLGSIDMCNETSPFILGLSGLFRPVTATLFALAIVQILKLEIVTIHLPPIQPGETDNNPLEHFYLLVAFLAGFSERFGSDLIGRAERVIATSDPEPKAVEATSTIEHRSEATGGASVVNQTPSA